MPTGIPALFIRAMSDSAPYFPLFLGGDQWEFRGAEIYGADEMRDCIAPGKSGPALPPAVEEPSHPVPRQDDDGIGRGVDPGRGVVVNGDCWEKQGKGGSRQQGRKAPAHSAGQRRDKRRQRHDAQHFGIPIPVSDT